MKKTIWVLFVVGLLVLGCVSMKDQPAYESSFGNNLGLMKLYAKYPECQDQKGQGEFVECVRAIQAKEDGKLR